MKRAINSARVRSPHPRGLLSLIIPDEFIDWCRALGTEPYICLNMGTGTLEDALAWVEYCNSSANTYYANLRRKNGHEQPHNVKVSLFSLSVTSPDLIMLTVLVSR